MGAPRPLICRTPVLGTGETIKWAVATAMSHRQREQSEDPETATRALRRFARWLHTSIERPPKVPLTRTEKMLARVLQNQNDGDELQRIIDED